MGSTSQSRCTSKGSSTPGDSPYPLDHWASRKREVAPPIAEAISFAVQTEDQPIYQHLKPGVTTSPLPGAGNHNVVGLYFEGHSYCLKQPTPTNRHNGDPELVLRREVGGMCMLVDRVPDRCPHPLSWEADPAWLLMELLPGKHLGNVALTESQLLELAAAYKALYQITPTTLGEPLWELDWNIRFLVESMRDHLPMLVQAGQEHAAAAEAASLMGDWLESEEPACFLEASDCVVFARGDENMANAIWDGERIRFVDFEYCGWNDFPRDLSLVTEHVQSYATPIEGWNVFLEQFDLTGDQRRRLQAGRRRQALYWLAKECLKPGSLHGLPEGNRIQILLDRARELCR